MLMNNVSGKNRYVNTLILIMASFKVCTVNVNGLRNQVQRRQIFASCNSQNLDILLLHWETPPLASKKPGSGRESLTDAGSGSSSSRGAAILFFNRKQWDLIDDLRNNVGRIISITAKTRNNSTRQLIFHEQLHTYTHGRTKSKPGALG